MKKQQKRNQEKIKVNRKVLRHRSTRSAQAKQSCHSNGFVYSIDKNEVVEIIGETIFDGNEALRLTSKQFNKVYGYLFVELK